MSTNLSLLANLVGIGTGCAVGWLSPSLPILLSIDSPLASGTITQTDASWIGAMIPFGGFFGTLIFGSLAYYIGSKHSLVYCTIPLIVSSSSDSVNGIKFNLITISKKISSYRGSQ